MATKYYVPVKRYPTLESQIQAVRELIQRRNKDIDPNAPLKNLGIETDAYFNKGKVYRVFELA